MPLTDPCNDSLSNAIFPSAWKQAPFMPLAKSEALNSPSDTRPIAQLSELSRVLERLVHVQLFSYLEAHKLLDEWQAGFRLGHITSTALLGVLDDVRLAIDKRVVTILILFDYSKAFDSIPHSKLLAKLRALNIADQTLRWFFSYLADYG